MFWKSTDSLSWPWPLDTPHIRKWQYQKGPLSGYGNINDTVDAMQEGHCLLCGKLISHHHHIVPGNRNGIDTIADFTGLCDDHLNLVHKEKALYDKMIRRKAGLNKKYGAFRVQNQIIPGLTEELSKLTPTAVTNGWNTKTFRETHGIPKDHHADTYCIACSVLENPDNIVREHAGQFQIRQFSRHDRKACIRHMLDRKYTLNGTVVAVTRHKAMQSIPGEKNGTKQAADSLEQYVQRADAVKAGYLRVKNMRQFIRTWTGFFHVPSFW